jgi:thiol-disulfide isomerase/thioredoxin
MRYYFTSLLILVTIVATSQTQLPKQLKVTDIMGNSLTLAEVVKGDLPIIMTFWATWCKPCQEELEALKEATDEWHGKVRIIAISVDDSRAYAKVKALVNGKKWPFEVFMDTNQEFLQAMNINGIPFSLVAEPNGKIIYTHQGYSPGAEIELLEKALQLKTNK